MDLMSWLRAEWDRVLGFTLVGLGAVLLVLGYLGVSESPYVAEQLSYIASGGLGGLFLLGAGATLLILADLHDEWRKLDRVEAILSGELPFPARPATNGSAPSPAPAAGPAGNAAPAAAGTTPALMVERARADAGVAPSGGPTAAAVLRRERLSLGIGLLLAVAVLAGSYARVSSVDEPKPAIAAVAVAVFGLLLVGLGAVGSTVTVKRHVQLRKARLFSAWLGPEEVRTTSARVGSGLVTSPGITRYHRAGCAAVAGLATRSVERRNVPAGLAPCHLCDADAD